MALGTGVCMASGSSSIVGWSCRLRLSRTFLDEEEAAAGVELDLVALLDGILTALSPCFCFFLAGEERRCEDLAAGVASSSWFACLRFLAGGILGGARGEVAIRKVSASGC